MKLLIALLAYFLWHLTSLSAAVPVPFDVDLGAQPPQVFTLQRPRGEAYDLEAVLKIHGKPFAPAITNACIYWQTNGMENLYWSAPASVSNNVLRASWLPSMDPGAATVRGYIGDPGHVYAAAFQFRFTSSPGDLPNALPLPTPVIDFARVTVLNAPWSGGGGSGGTNTNDVRAIVDDAVSGTNAVKAAVSAIPSISSSISSHGSQLSQLSQDKRDKTDNVCVTDSFGPWVATSLTEGKTFEYQPFYDGEWGGWIWSEIASGGDMYPWLSPSTSVSATNATFSFMGSSFTATRQLVAASNDTFVTQHFVTNFVSRHASPPSPTLRLHDDVLGCWWIIKIVNGVMTREVE